MMARILGFLFVAAIALSSFGYSNADTSSNHLQFDQELDPVLAEQIANELAANPDAAHDREKRLILLKKIGLKAGLLDFVFGKIDAFIDSKTRFINELDKQNVIKNEKYFGITPPPRNNYKNNLVGTLLTAKKNFIGSALSSIISSKLSHASGSLGFGGLASLSGGSGGSSSSSSHGGAGASFSAGAGLGGASYGGAGAGASATLPGVGSASVGSSVSLPLLDASHGVGLGGAQALYRFNAGYKTTTRAPVQFELNAPVSFVIPDRLYGSSFTLVTNASKIISDVIYNTAGRAQEFAETINNQLKTKFGFAKKLIKIGDDHKHG